MSEKLNGNQIAANTFAYRNLKKEFVSFTPTESISKNAHLELGENYETKIVEDRPTDWFEMAQVDADTVGLANILELARRNGENIFDGRYSFKDEEALDLGDLNPNDPEAVKKMATGGKEAAAKLESIASQLGVSVDALVDSFIKGTLAEVIEKSQSVTKTEEGESK